MERVYTSKYQYFEKYSKQVSAYDGSRVIELAWILCDWDGNGTLKSFLIKPNGFEIKNSHIHGITHEMAETEGHRFEDVACEFFEDLKKAKLLVGHKAVFDVYVLRAELRRAGFIDIAKHLRSLPFFCTMHRFYLIGSGTYIKLADLCNVFFSDSVLTMHRAGSDVLATLLCFREIGEFFCNLYIGDKVDKLDKILEYLQVYKLIEQCKNDHAEKINENVDEIDFTDATYHGINADDEFIKIIALNPKMSIENIVKKSMDISNIKFIENYVEKLF